jgi:hypothetical protein
LPIATGSAKVDVVAKKKWHDLSPRTRGLILAGGALDGTLRVIALVDLARRPAAGIRGSKAGWASAIVVLNSAGVVPVLYLVHGRRR